MFADSSPDDCAKIMGLEGWERCVVSATLSLFSGPAIRLTAGVGGPCAKIRAAAL